MRSFFDEKNARKELRRYNKKGADKATAALIRMVSPLLNSDAHASLLDIGGGIGAIPLELMEHGVDRVTNVDASPGFQKVALETARERGVADHITFVGGDFVDASERIEEHDLVTLDKVICCYPDMKTLVRRSARHARKYYALVYPRNVWYAHIVTIVGTIGMKLLRNAFRPFIHADADVESTLVAEGFALRAQEHHLFWQIRLWERL